MCVAVCRPLRLPTQGPLVMCPPAEDNYGVDACSILCLDTSPPVIVMATCDGSLHHCLVLPTSATDSKDKVWCDAIIEMYIHVIIVRRSFCFLFKQPYLLVQTCLCICQASTLSKDWTLRLLFLSSQVYQVHVPAHLTQETNAAKVEM
jgi:hypothetical protein